MHKDNIEETKRVHMLKEENGLTPRAFFMSIYERRLKEEIKQLGNSIKMDASLLEINMLFNGNHG